MSDNQSNNKRIAKNSLSCEISSLSAHTWLVSEAESSQALRGVLSYFSCEDSDSWSIK